MDTLLKTKTIRSAICLFASLMLIFALVPWTRTADVAQASEAADAVPSVLLIDSGLGDYDATAALWLGNDVQKVASKGRANLVSSDDASWYQEGAASKAPQTYLLSTKSGACASATDVVWALNQIAKTSKQPKTFVVAFGNSGYSLCKYLEGSTSEKISKRADIVGAAFLGTAFNGYSAISQYDDLSIWDTLAAAAGVSRSDIKPGSKFLSTLAGNAANIPSNLKILQEKGTVDDMGFGETDGAALQDDMNFLKNSTAYLQTVTARASVSKAIGLSRIWGDKDIKTTAGETELDSALIERLSGLESYGSSSEACYQVLNFYDQWFSGQVPATHVSSVLALDVSGSMLATLSNGQSKFDAAKEAAVDYMQAISIRSKAKYAVPADVTVLGFDTQVQTITAGVGKSSQDKIKSLSTGGNTDISKVITAALDSLDASPACADKRILLLSDGLNTEGSTDDSILSGPVEKAKKAGVAIDTIALGDFNDADRDFLKSVSKSTGGVFSESKDAAALTAGFLRSYYSSLGTLLYDKDFDGGKTIKLGTVDESTKSLEVGLVSGKDFKNVKLLCNGKKLSKSQYSVTASKGLVAIQVETPEAGEYSVSLGKSVGQGHAFVSGCCIQHQLTVVQDPNGDLPRMLMIIAAIGLVVLIVVVIVVSKKKSNHQKTRPDKGAN